MLSKILDFLKEHGIDVIESNQTSIVTEHKIQGGMVRIKGLFNNLKEKRLPSYYLCDRKSYGLLAHIGWHEGEEDIGLCCGGATDVLSLNYYDPGKVYYEGLLKIIGLLSPIINNSTENSEQVMEEYLGHLNWVKDPTDPKIMFMGQYLPGAKPLDSYIPQGEGFKTIIIANKELSISENYILAHQIKKYKKLQNAYIIELDKLPLPPTPKDDIGNWWKCLLEQQSESLKAELSELCTRRSNHFYFICYKKFKGKILTFCVNCKNSRRKDLAPLVGDLKNWEISIIKVIQHTKEFLLPRSGGTLDFQDKKVLLVGCGSVGSFIAKQLIQSGIGEMTFVDSDEFEAENLYRHNLSMRYEGLKKSQALKSFLEEKYPYTNIEALTMRLIKIPQDIMKKQDLIVVAIGSPTDERFFNEFLKNKGIQVNTIYTWLEGFGVGGHAVYVDPIMADGCLQCNYIDVNEEVPILHSNMNFLYPNQDTAKDIGGCGTLFLPYTHLDAEQTALMVSRMAIDVLSGKVNKSVRMSWKGSLVDALAQRLELTHRCYKYNDSKYEKFKQKSCYVCG